MEEKASKVDFLHRKQPKSHQSQKAKKPPAMQNKNHFARNKKCPVPNSHSEVSSCWPYSAAWSHRRFSPPQQAWKNGHTNSPMRMLGCLCACERAFAAGGGVMEDAGVPAYAACVRRGVRRCVGVRMRELAHAWVRA